MWYICANPSEIRVIESKFERQGGDILVRDDKKFLVLRFLNLQPTDQKSLEFLVAKHKKHLRNVFNEQRGTIDFSNEEPFSYL